MVELQGLTLKQPPETSIVLMTLEGGFEKTEAG